MSTQSIKEHDVATVHNKIDRALACLGNKIIMEDRFGVKSNYSKKDSFMLIYYKRVFDERYCKNNINYNLSRVNNLTLKCK